TPHQRLVVLTPIGHPITRFRRLFHQRTPLSEKRQSIPARKTRDSGQLFDKATQYYTNDHKPFFDNLAVPFLCIRLSATCWQPSQCAPQSFVRFVPSPPNSQQMNSVEIVN